MSTNYLHLRKDGGIAYLSVETEDEVRKTLGLEKNPNNRFSPIFPVIIGEGITPKRDADYFVGFFCAECPCVFIGRILADVERPSQPGLWFSHGLASLIFFSKSVAEIENVAKNHKADLRAFEIWQVQGGQVSSYALSLSDPAPLRQDFGGLLPYSSLPPEQVSILDELAHALGVSIHRSAQYMPENLELIARLVGAVNELISELRWLWDPSLAPPTAFSAAAAAELRSDPTQCQKHIHQRTGELVQIAASLSAANTQSFSGSFPILSAPPSSPGTHSLLGVGTTHRALAKFSVFVEKIFQKYPVASVIRDHFATAPPVEVFPLMKNYEPTRWEVDEATHLDYYFDKGIKPEPGTYNIVYYSMRIGFRESTFSTTAAWHALFLCDEARWSLMTLSHEILHAHVAEVLAALFDDQKHDLPEKAFKRYASMFKEDVHRNAQTPRHLIDSLRSIVLNYQAMYPQYTEIGDLAAKNRNAGDESDVEYGLRLPPEDVVLDPLSGVFHEINEIIVHVLDYYYFYECNETLYLGSLWESWSQVPKVLHEIEHYVFRSLVAIASRREEVGVSPTDRFENAVSRLKGVLEKLKARTSSSIIAAEALKCLTSEKALDRLLAHFHIGVYLADMTSSFLFSKHINGSLYADKNCRKDGLGMYYYLIDTGDFRDFEVLSPVGLVSSRLRASLCENSGSMSASHRSAWLLLLCASVRDKEGGQDV